MGLSFNQIPHSNRLSPLDVTTPETQDKNTGNFGIRTHNAVSNFILNFLSIFGVKKVVSVTNDKGEVTHLNRASLNKWLERHSCDPNQCTNDQEYVKAINLVRNVAISVVNQKNKALLTDTLSKVAQFKKERLNDSYVPYKTSEGKSETAALIDFAWPEGEKARTDGYALDSSAPGYVGMGHTVTNIKVDSKKVFGGAGMKIHISIDPTIPGNRLKAFKALEPILTGENGVVQFKVYAGPKKEDLENWFNDAPPQRPGGQQGKEITLYLVDEPQIQKAIAAGKSEAEIAAARKFVKTPEQTAKLIEDCLAALEKADVKGIGYLQNVSDKYLNDEKSVGIRDDRKADGTLDDYAHVGEHAHGNYVNGVPQWNDPADDVINLLKINK